MLFLGSWLSGYFIIATNAWMQHPVAYSTAEDGRLFVNSLTDLLTNPWIFWQYAHTMTASVVTASFVMAAFGALYFLSGSYMTHARTFVQTGVVAGAIACVLMIFPTGDGNAKQVFEHQPVKGAAFEGLFRTERGAGLILVGQPNMETLTIDNPLVLPRLLSFLVYDEMWAEVKGLDAFPRGTNGRTMSLCCITRITSWLAWERSSPRLWASRCCCSGVADYSNRNGCCGCSSSPPRSPTSPRQPAG